MERDILLDIEDLTIKLDSKVLINKWSFSIRRGDVVSIVGDNGSGKTTLLKTIAGIKKQYSGFVKKSEGVKVSYSPQVSELERHIPINLESFLSLKGIMDFNLLERLGLDKKLKTSIADLSGGELQKMLFYFAIIDNADVIMLDEPENHLSQNSVKSIFDIIEEISKDKAFIIVSHDRTRIPSYNKHILEIDKIISCEKHEECCA